MHLLVTAGSTQVPIDAVRVISNRFTGRTGVRIAREAYLRGHHVTLLASHPEIVAAEMAGRAIDPVRWHLLPYSTFDELEVCLSNHIRTTSFDAIIHAAAVSDYRCAAVYGPAPGNRFDPTTGEWRGIEPIRLIDQSAGKVKSDEPELWLRLVRTPKLIDCMRRDWGFTGRLVKFKLEVGITEEHLLQVAEASRRHSAADVMVANTTEGAASWAYLGTGAGEYLRVSRDELPLRLIDKLESLIGG